MTGHYLPDITKQWFNFWSLDNMWTMAKVRNGFADLPYERFHTFAIKKNGIVVGELKFASRPKNAGGPAWRGKLIGLGDCGMDIVYFGSNKTDVLNWFKNHSKVKDIV